MTGRDHTQLGDRGGGELLRWKHRGWCYVLRSGTGLSEVKKSFIPDDAGWSWEDDATQRKRRRREFWSTWCFDHHRSFLRVEWLGEKNRLEIKNVYSPFFPVRSLVFFGRGGGWWSWSSRGEGFYLKTKRGF